MFRPIRTLIMMVMVYFAGIMTERFMHGDRCLDAGGAMNGPICEGIRE